MRKYEEVGLDARIERMHGAERARFGVGAHDGSRRALNHALNRGALAALTALDAHGHNVAVHDLAQRATSQLQRPFGCLDEPVPFGKANRARQARTPLTPHRRTPPASRTLSAHIPSPTSSNKHDESHAPGVCDSFSPTAKGTQGAARHPYRESRPLPLSDSAGVRQGRTPRTSEEEVTGFFTRKSPRATP